MRKIFLALALILASTLLFADTHTAASVALADVKTAIAAASAGDTISIPAGEATWTDYLSVTKSLYIIGAGIDVTIINDGYTRPGGGSFEPTNNLISFVPTIPADNPSFRLSGMTINFTSDNGIYLQNTSIYDCTKIRIDHIKISASGLFFERYGLMHGCMDNCTITGDLDGGGPSSLWTSNGYEFGTNSNFYIEDCTWTSSANDVAIFQAGNGPMRYSWRHNNITLPTGTQIFPLFDQHGNQPSAYSCMGAEIYENTINLQTNTWTTLFYDHRGGKSLIYNNTVTWASGGGISTRVQEEHQDSDNPPATNGINGQPQHISDSYYWGNTKNGAVLNPTASSTLVCSTCSKTVPTADQDFWIENASFNGSSGIGVGLLAARPSSGLTVGVGYWATDTSTLYRATGATTWETYYTPYTYPHPLRGEGENYPKATVGAGAKIVIEAGGKLVIK